MFKRAYLYACTAPVPNSADTADDEYETLTKIAAQEQSKRIKRSTKQKPSDSAEKDDVEEETQDDGDMVHWMPGGKVAKCRLCIGKTMLNQEAVQKHLDSKAHKTMVKRTTTRRQEAQMMRKRFMERMESVEKKAADSIRQSKKR